jgi:hypothetical protein
LGKVRYVWFLNLVLLDLLVSSKYYSFGKSALATLSLQFPSFDYGRRIAMEEPLFRCKHCKMILVKRNLDQLYCGKRACQKARNNAWRRAKYESDPDYRANQQASTKAWITTQGGSAAYFRDYRRQRKAKQQLHERKTQLKENTHGAQQTSITESANSNAKSPQNVVKSGKYKLSRCDTANSGTDQIRLFCFTVDAPRGRPQGRLNEFVKYPGGRAGQEF